MPGEAALLLTCSKLVCIMCESCVLFSLLEKVSDLEIQEILVDYITENHMSMEHAHRLQVCESMLF